MNCGSASVMRLMRQCFPFLSFLHSVFLSFFSSSFSFLSLFISLSFLFLVYLPPPLISVFLSFLYFFLPGPLLSSFPFSRIIFLCNNPRSLSFFLFCLFPIVLFPLFSPSLCPYWQSVELPFLFRVQSMPGVLMELEMRSVEPGDMKSVIVDEMSILWSAIRSSAEQRQKITLIIQPNHS